MTVQNYFTRCKQKIELRNLYYFLFHKLFRSCSKAYSKTVHVAQLFISLFVKFLLTT